MQLKALLVENNDVSIQTVKLALEEQVKESTLFDKFDPDTDLDIRYDFDEVIALVAEQVFHVAILDYNLEEYTGLEVFALLLKGDLLKESKVIVYTGYTPDPEEVNIELEAYRMGAFKYVQKGNIEDLKTVVKEALETIEREHLRQMIGSFIPRKLTDQKELDRLAALAEMRHVYKAILHTDITHCTYYIRQLKEKGHYEKVGQLIRDLSSWQADRVLDLEGWIDKFLGGGLVAYFGRSLDKQTDDLEMKVLCQNAVQAAMDLAEGFFGMLRKSEEENKISNLSNQLMNIVNIRCVVHFGNVSWGIIGSKSYHDLTLLTDDAQIPAAILNHYREEDVKRQEDADEKKQPYVKINGEVHVTEFFKKHLDFDAGDPTVLKLPGHAKDGVEVYHVRTQADVQSPDQSKPQPAPMPRRSS